MAELRLNIKESFKNKLKAEAASKGFYFKDYLIKILEDR